MFALTRIEFKPTHAFLIVSFSQVTSFAQKSLLAFSRLARSGSCYRNPTPAFCHNREISFCVRGSRLPSSRRVL